MKNITAVVLAGGESKRMGRDKAFLTFRGKTFLRHILETVSSFADQIIVSANKEPDIYKKEAEGISISIVKDINPFKGPLNAVASCSDYIENDTVFIATCDTPLIKIQAVNFLYENLKGHDCVIPVINGKFQPMNTFYTKKAVLKAKKLYKEGINSMFKWIKTLDTVFLDEKQLKLYDKDLVSFKSINTPSDYHAFLKNYEV